MELQKLVRKVKAAKYVAILPSVVIGADRVRRETNEVKDLEDQLAALKAMDLDSLPAYILTHRLPKLTFLHPILESVLSSIPESTTLPTVDAKTAEGKGRNRVLANKLVKEATDEVIRAVSKRMGQEVEDRPVVVKVVKKVEVEVVEVELPELEPGKRLSKRALRAAKGAAKALLPKKGMDPSRKAAIEAATRLEGDDGDADSEEGDGFVSGSDDEADDDDEVMREMARLGGGSEYSDEDNSDEGEEYNSDAALSASSPPKPSTSKSKPKASFPPPKSTKSSRTVSKPITSSAFLPSLASGYISYSDSDGEDAHWVKEEEKGDKKERKNRRGQRARQASVPSSPRPIACTDFILHVVSGSRSTGVERITSSRVREQHPHRQKEAKRTEETPSNAPPSPSPSPPSRSSLSTLLQQLEQSATRTQSPSLRDMSVQSRRGCILRGRRRGKRRMRSRIWLLRRGGRRRSLRDRNRGSCNVVLCEVWSMSSSCPSCSIWCMCADRE